MAFKTEKEICKACIERKRRMLDGLCPAHASERARTEMAKERAARQPNKQTLRDRLWLAACTDTTVTLTSSEAHQLHGIAQWIALRLKEFKYTSSDEKRLIETLLAALDT